MEIYTGDLIDMAISYAERISTRIDYRGYVVEDGCCDLVRDVRRVLHERLSEAFTDLVENHDKVLTPNDLKVDTSKYDWFNESLALGIPELLELLCRLEVSHELYEFGVLKRTYG